MLSIADLIQIGGITAVEYCGGPAINIGIGRIDATEDQIPPENILQDPNEDWSIMVEKYHRMGLSDYDIVALNGVHTLGQSHSDRSGISGRWTMNPYLFDNTYYKEVLNPNSKYLKTNMETGMVSDPKMKEQMEMYAQDQEKFFEDYAVAHQKMSEWGQEANIKYEIQDRSFA